MNPERWQAIDKLLSEALEREPGQRKDFLEQACACDEELRKEVGLLLEAHDRAGSFIEKPALDQAAFLPPPSLIGRKSGPFEILSLLGRGGMGERLQGPRTARLDRINALKIPSSGSAQGILTVYQEFIRGSRSGIGSEPSQHRHYL